MQSIMRLGTVPGSHFEARSAHRRAGIASWRSCPSCSSPAGAQLGTGRDCSSGHHYSRRQSSKRLHRSHSKPTARDGVEASFDPCPQIARRPVLDCFTDCAGQLRRPEDSDSLLLRPQAFRAKISEAIAPQPDHFGAVLLCRNPSSDHQPHVSTHLHNRAQYRAETARACASNHRTIELDRVERQGLEAYLAADLSRP